MMDFLIRPSVVICIVIPLFLIILAKLKNMIKTLSSPNPTNKLPKSYPIIGSFFALSKNRERFVQWTSEIVTSTPNLTFHLQRTIGQKSIITANAANVQHILKSHFHNYEKGDFFKNSLRDFLGDGIFNTDGEKWKFQRQVSSHEFNAKSLRKFVEHVVDAEITDRLNPIMQNAADNKLCSISKTSFNDSLSTTYEKFSLAFDKCVELSTKRFRSFIPYSWKIKRALNVGSEKQLKIAVAQVRDIAKEIIGNKNKKIGHGKNSSDDDLLSRFLSSGHSDENFVGDIVISFILAGKDTTSAALTWFFWLISNHPQVESEILREINEKSSDTSLSAYDEVKDMVYTHASLCESMRLYPPVPVDTKAALKDDVLPDGTVVKKGMRVSYHPYAMGRVEKVWGKDWGEFRPERWLEKEEEDVKWRFVNRDLSGEESGWRRPA
ncbi:hypothetical protein OROHE_008415 [Orobanche hederae]